MADPVFKTNGGGGDYTRKILTLTNIYEYLRSRGIEWKQRIMINPGDIDSVLNDHFSRSIIHKGQVLWYIETCEPRCRTKHFHRKAQHMTLFCKPKPKACKYRMTYKLYSGESTHDVTGYHLYQSGDIAVLIKVRFVKIR